MSGTSFGKAYGHSYKFTKENYSMIPLPGTTGAGNYYGGIVLSAGDLLVSITPTGANDGNGNPTFTTSGTPQAPPAAMTLAYFSQPARTKLMKDQNNPWDSSPTKRLPPGQSTWHSGGGNFGFADGHVHFESRTDKGPPGNPYQLNRFCDGATGAPPVGSSEPCNSAGMVRSSP